MKNVLWSAVPAVLAVLRLQEALTTGSWAAGITGLGFVGLAVAWFIRPPFTPREVAIPPERRTLFVVSQGVGLALLVIGLLWRLGA